MGGLTVWKGSKLRGLGVGGPHKHTPAAVWEGGQAERRETCRAEATPGRGRGGQGQWGAHRALSGQGRPWEGLPQGAPSVAVWGCARQCCQDSAQRASLPDPRTPIMQSVLWVPAWMEDHSQMDEGLDDSSVLILLPWLPGNTPPPCPPHHSAIFLFCSTAQDEKPGSWAWHSRPVLPITTALSAPPCLLKAPLQPCAPKKCSVSPPQHRSLPSSSLSMSWC